jgi:hypothetical protein
LAIVAVDTHGCANVDGGIIVGTGTQGPNMEQNKRSFGELDLNVEPTGTLNDNGNFARYLSNILSLF